MILGPQEALEHLADATGRPKALRLRLVEGVQREVAGAIHHEGHHPLATWIARVKGERAKALGTDHQSFSWVPHATSPAWIYGALAVRKERQRPTMTCYAMDIQQ